MSTTTITIPDMRVQLTFEQLLTAVRQLNYSDRRKLVKEIMTETDLDMERADLSEEMHAWLIDVQSRHPFAKMSKGEVLDILRQSREAVWAERHEN